MNTTTQKLIALALAAVAGLAVLVTGGWLTTESVLASAQAPQDKQRIEDLLDKGRTEAAYAADLHAEFDRQAEMSLARTARQETLACWLLTAAVVFVMSSQRLMKLRGRRLTLPPKLVQLSLPPADAPTGCACADCGTRSEAADIDLAPVDEIVAREGRAPETAIPILQAVQAHYRYLPVAALRRVCEQTEITPAQLAGVASFYTQFRSTPVGRHVVKVCHGTACHVAGAPRITDELRRQLGIPAGTDTDAAGEYTVEKVACLGCCTLAPVVQIDGLTHGHVRSDTALEVVAHSVEGGRNGRDGAVVPPQPVGEAAGEVRIGLGSCCIANGSGNVHHALADALARTGAHVTVKRVGCVGMCHQTPMVEIDVPGTPPALYSRVQPDAVGAIVRRHFPATRLTQRVRDTVADAVGSFRNGAARQIAARHSLELRDPPVAAFIGPQQHIATEHCGQLDPTDLDEYRRHDGFKALERCVRELRPEDVIDEIRRSGLRGRGGAGYPAAEKWSRVRAAPGPLKYIICNGDEGDPGAFMDRMLMESYPYRIIEGVALAALATGATEGCFYIRREYPLATGRMRDALQQCEERGLLGNDVLGSGQRLHLRVVEGAGAFVCGEESALIASLEGRRGIPSLRPPYPAESGLWGRPTLVSNVETYALLPWILRHGSAAFAALGSPTSAGTKVFALTGKIRRGGLIEVPMGVTIREIVEDIGGGIKDGREFKAVQIGGPSGGCVPAELADTPIDYEALAEVGAMMGSGGLVVLDDTDCMVDIARYFLTFTQDQSCGKCTPCRVGTRRLLDILERLCEGAGQPGDLEKLEHLALMVNQGSLCGLGKTAPNPILTTLRYFRSEYEAHLAGRCPAGRCKALITYTVTDACTGCTLCAQHCPADAIEMRPYEQHEIDSEKCTRCDVCRVKCPEDAIRIV